MEEVNEGRKFSSAFFNQFRWPAVSHINFTKDQWGKTCNSLGKQITSKRTKVAHLWLCTSAISDINLWGLILNLLHTHKPESLSTCTN